MNGSVYLAHHGVKGQKWGVRRYQNENGSYTNTGKSHRKEFAKTLGVAAAAGLVGGILSGTAGFALSTANPVFISAAAATYIGKSAVTNSLGTIGSTAVRTLASSESTNRGKEAIYGRK